MQIKRREGIYIGIMILLFFPLTSWAMDFPEVNMGKAKLRPSLSTSSEYHSNINLTHKHKGSMIYRVTPGLTLQVPLERVFFQMDTDVRYMNVERGDSIWTGHGRALLRYSLNNRSSLGLSHDFSRGELYNFTSGNWFDLHQSEFSIKHQLDPQLAISLAGNQEKYETHIKDGVEGFTDYHQYGGKFIVDNKFTPSTTASLTGIYAKRTFNDFVGKDYKSWTGTLSVSQKLNPRITVGAYGGYTGRDYKIYQNAQEMVYGSDFNFILSNLSTFRISYSHGLQDTFYPKDTTLLKNHFDTDETLENLLPDNYRYFETDHIAANLTYHFTDKDTIDIGGAYMSSHSGQDQPFVMNLVDRRYLKERAYYSGLSYSHKFTPWLAFDVKGSYGARVSKAREKYDYYTASSGMSLSF